MENMLIQLILSANTWFGGILTGIITGVISSVIVMLMFNEYSRRKKSLEGKHLYEYLDPDLYPIEIIGVDKIIINRKRFIEALKFLTKEKDKLAAFELFAIGDGNGIIKDFSIEEKILYEKFIKNYSLEEFKIWRKDYEKRLEPFKEIINSIGDTFNNLEFEFVLHNALNPIKSIVAIVNNISSRKINDPTTNLGIELIKDYGRILDKTNKKRSEIGYFVVKEFQYRS